MPFLQEIIHKLEEGSAYRYPRIILCCLAVLGLFIWYDVRSFHNMDTQEGMDASQVARNLAEGRGFTTQFVRPFSVALIREHDVKKHPGNISDPAHLKNNLHPDIANAPAYPLALAGVMKVAPFHYDVNLKHGFWSIPPVFPGSPRIFWRYEPDFLIALFNQMLFFGVVLITFLLTRKLFDRAVAWTSAILLLGCEQLWRFTLSGLSTMLAMLLFMGLIWIIVLIEESVREAKGSERRLVLLSISAGLLLGLCALTRYSLGWLIIPVLAFLILFGGTRKALLCITVLGIFLLTLSPWVYRNWTISGTPFGTAGYAAVEGTYLFPETKLGRSLSPSFNQLSMFGFTSKLLANSRKMVQTDLPKLGGSWILPFFLVGLLLGFRHLGIRRLRYFLMGALPVLFVAQALGRTALSEADPAIHSENLLIFLFPLVLVYGVSLFFMLLDQMNLVFPALRYAVIGLFGLLMCLPMVYSFLPPHPLPLAYPPYNPPVIQTTSRWMSPDELIMSDMPWAVAWYGNRQCIWFTLNAERDFFTVNDELKPVRAVYLTPLFMDSRFLTEWIKAGEGSWGQFVVRFLVEKEAPRYFPLRISPKDYLPAQIFVTDWERWRKNPEP